MTAFSPVNSWHDMRQSVSFYLSDHTDISVADLLRRAAVHDESKFELDERPFYEDAFAELQMYAYGTDEFRAALKKIKPAVQHHYSVNDHHPEFHEHGIEDMDNHQIEEMIWDWLAASERSQTDFEKGLEINRERFKIEPQLFRIIRNTAKKLAKAA